MSEYTENTLTGYKGPEFQQKLLWQLLVEPEYAERTIPVLAVEYFDDPNIKRLFLIMLEYIKAYGKAPNLQNHSIIQAINEFKTPNNVIEEESLFAVIERVRLWNERVLNQTLSHDGDVVQQSTTTFIKQQEYRKYAENILIRIKNGEIKDKRAIAEIEEKLQKIGLIGNEEDCGSDVTEGLENALKKEFRKTIPTGVFTIDALTGGGLGKGEIGLILTPSGVGKTTLLTVIANTAREQNLNVLQIIFEDTKEQIQRKHVTLWTKIPLSQLDEQHEAALRLSTEHINAMGPGRLTIKKFSQEDTTMRDVKDYILREQKKKGFKFDIVVLDYLDCLESHKKVTDRNEAELVIVKSFEALASDLDIPMWSAIQSNRSGFDAELVEAHQAGGNIKRVQKAHFFMSVAKTPDQKEASLANIRIIKARFAQDGQTFKDCIFNNDTMQIIIRDDRYVGGAVYSNKKKITDEIIEENALKIEEHAKGMGLYHVATGSALPLDPLGDMREKFMQQEGIVEKKPFEFVSPGVSTREKLNSEGISEGVNEGITHPEAQFHEDQIKNDGVNEGASEGVNKGITPLRIVKGIDVEILEIEEDKPIEKIDGVNDGVIPVQPLSPPNGLQTLIKLNEQFEWNGQSGKTENEVINEVEVKYEDIKAGDVLKSPETLPAGIFTRDESNNIVVLGVATESKILPQMKKSDIVKEKFDAVEAEKKMLIDPEEGTSGQKHLMDMLRGMRVNEIVNKKE